MKSTLILTTGWSDGIKEMETTGGEAFPKSTTGSESLALAFGRSEMLFGVTGAAQPKTNWQWHWS